MGDAGHYARVGEMIDKPTYNSVILTYKGHSFRLKKTEAGLFFGKGVGRVTNFKALDLTRFHPLGSG